AGRALSFLTPLLALVAAHQCHHSLAHAALNAAHNRRHVQLLKQVMESQQEQKQKPGAPDGEPTAPAGTEPPSQASPGSGTDPPGAGADPPADKSLEAGVQTPADKPLEAGVQSPADGSTTQKAVSPRDAPLRIPQRGDEDYFEALGLVVGRLQADHEQESTACADLLGALLEHSEGLYSPTAAAAVHAHQAHTHGLHGYLNVNRPCTLDHLESFSPKTRDGNRVSIMPGLGQEDDIQRARAADVKELINFVV
ncbi:uncharacterized protein LOC108683013, partial [Hyalella azteca]|uniref:Uncharacterized protein LOC108683013 n=1 Tax=Hyalella azteca TaxID=294128 RepID=A0A8B7PRB1_HYAAZ